MNKRTRTIAIIAAVPVVLLLALVLLVRGTTLQTAPVQPEAVVCPADTPAVQPGQALKVLSYNVQYMAGKGYVFFYDMPDNSGPDERPSPESITHTLAEVARIIEDENPDIVLLQEVDDGAARTDHEDQVSRLRALLPQGAYPCSAATFYWKAAYVPHSRIHGAVGMKLVTLSTYRISEATRYQLALVPADPLTQQFNLKRAVLETRLPIAGNEQPDVLILNTHLEAFAQGTDTMERQVAEVTALLKQRTAAGYPWLIGGDFNLLPPGSAYERLSAVQQSYYQPESELAVLYDTYQAIPTREDVDGPEAAQWYTHFPNNPAFDGPNKTIDYFFLSPEMTISDAYVRQHDTLDISDHLPLVVEVALPAE